MISAGIFLFPFFIKYIRQTPLNKIPLILLSGLLGNFIPAYLFCIAETHIDSALAGILNGLAPLMALLAGFFLFRAPIVKRQLLGLSIGLLGVILLFVVKGVDAGYWYYGLWIVLATVCYGINISLVHHQLKGYNSLQLSAIALLFCTVLALPILLFTGFFSILTGPVIPWSSLAACVTLGVMGTGVATVLFFLLISKTGGIMASMVTYAMPVVAIGWGLLAGEQISLLQVLCMGVILAGVYIVNKAKGETAKVK
jgi:drug/metabolite transporter (DMT)-like permease